MGTTTGAVMSPLPFLAGAGGDRNWDGEPWRGLLVGESAAMRQVVDTVRLISQRRSTVLISGETGTGKEVLARAIHMASDRSRFPLVAVNCSALPENLLEAELFGHVRGAFTGAINQRVGRFEQAHRGTIFLDEVGDMPFELQAKLLRVLQEREVQRLGSSETIKIDVRVIAATNVDLPAKVRRGEFREDLFYRLNVIPILLPPLRERRGDVALLAEYFVDKVCRQEGLPLKRISSGALARLTHYEWPGNVRQLENAIEMAVNLCGERDILEADDFPLSAAAAEAERMPVPAEGGPRIQMPDWGIDFERTVGAIELDLIRQALRRTKGNKKMAAELLRLKRTTLTAKIKALEGVYAPAV